MEDAQKVADEQAETVTASIEVLITAETTSIDNEWENEMQKIRGFVCECEQRRKENSTQQASCSDRLSPEFIYRTRLNTASLSHSEKDMFVMGTLLTSMNDSEMTRSTKQITKKRKQHRTTYTLHGTPVCRSTFCFVLGISKTLLQSIVQAYKDHGGVPRRRKNGHQRTNKD